MLALRLEAVGQSGEERGDGHGEVCGGWIRSGTGEPERDTATNNGQHDQDEQRRQVRSIMICRTAEAVKAEADVDERPHDEADDEAQREGKVEAFH